MKDFKINTTDGFTVENEEIVIYLENTHDIGHKFYDTLM